jgi:hypothetical protein
MAEVLRLGGRRQPDRRLGLSGQNDETLRVAVDVAEVVSRD